MQGKGKYYPGKVSEVMDDGTFSISYDDGDHEYEVPRDRVKQVTYLILNT